MAVSDFRHIVWPAAAAQTIAWAALFYSFPALLVEWERDLGWSKTQLTGAFTLALIIAAVLAPVIGRLVDRGHARFIFANCTCLGAVALYALSLVDSLWQFYTAWAVLGVAIAGTLYEACFALLTRCLGAQARRGITVVTLVAGFAGTVAFPTNNWMLSVTDWRSAVTVWAIALVVVVWPLMWIMTKAAESQAEVRVVASSRTTGQAMRVMRRGSFWLLAISFAMLALNHAMVLTHLLPLLAERQVPAATAVLAVSLLGPMQVLGRLLMLFFEKRSSPVQVSAWCFLALVAGAFVLLGAGAVPALLVTFALFQGAAVGVESIVKPVITAEILGRRNFGVISGLIAVASVGAYAMGPSAGSLLWSMGGYHFVIGSAAAMAAVGLVAVLGAACLSRRGG